MNRRLRSFVRATIVLVSLLAFAPFVPAPARAIQLRWSTGATDLTVSQNTQAVLVVQADSAEATLPNTWRLLWTTDSLAIQFSAFDPSSACLVDTAKVDSIVPPQTPADSAANQIMAYFCSAGSNNATTAYFLADLPGGGHGKLKVVAIDPNDTTQVIESNEVTFNGGVGGDYSTAILSASSEHNSVTYKLTLRGTGLTRAGRVALRATDSSWRVPLTLVSASDNQIVATTSLAATVPQCIVEASSGQSAVAAVALAQEPEPEVVESGACFSWFREDLLTPAAGLVSEIQPKDFAFVKGFADTVAHAYTLHLFYTRQNQELSNNGRDYLTTKNIGHATSSDFAWSTPPDTSLFPVRPGHFDNAHVWAPTVILKFPKFYLFYTGVDSLDHQRIGVITSQDLISWDRGDTAVFDVTKSNWAARGKYNSWVHCRDPFVMQDPDVPNLWLMYYVAVDSTSVDGCSSDTCARMAVGVARSYGDLTVWQDSTVLASTMRPTLLGETKVVESPHVFRRNGQWWMPYSVGGDRVFFETTSQGPAASAAQWGNPIWLRSVVEGAATTLKYYHASEYLQVSNYSYLAAFDDSLMTSDMQQIFPVDPDSAAVDSFKLGCPQIAAVGPGVLAPKTLRLTATGLSWGRRAIELRAAVPPAATARLAVYDLMGRRCRTLLDGALPAGTLTLRWDGRDQSGGVVPSGVYFARLSSDGKYATCRIVVIR